MIKLSKFPAQRGQLFPDQIKITWWDRLKLRLGISLGKHWLHGQHITFPLADIIRDRQHNRDIAEIEAMIAATPQHIKDEVAEQNKELWKAIDP